MPFIGYQKEQLDIIRDRGNKVVRYDIGCYECNPHNSKKPCKSGMWTNADIADWAIEEREQKIAELQAEIAKLKGEANNK